MIQSHVLTYEYRLRPNKVQEAALMATLIASRRLYNDCLEELISHYTETGKHLNLYAQDKLHLSAARQAAKNSTPTCRR